MLPLELGQNDTYDISQYLTGSVVCNLQQVPASRQRFSRMKKHCGAAEPAGWNDTLSLRKLSLCWSFLLDL